VSLQCNGLQLVAFQQHLMPALSCRITTRYLHGIKSVPIYEAPETPLIAFINARSGGRVGPALAFTLYRALGFQQVGERQQNQSRAASSGYCRHTCVLITACCSHMHARAPGG
jgi:hypothetical protein